MTSECFIGYAKLKGPTCNSTGIIWSMDFQVLNQYHMISLIYRLKLNFRFFILLNHIEMYEILPPFALIIKNTFFKTVIRI